MGFLNKISRIVDVLTEDESIVDVLTEDESVVDVLTDDESVVKGDNFERYVVHLFDIQKYFSVVDWTSDISRKHDCFVESDCNPDLVMRYKHKSKNEVFCIECKYRSSLYNKKLNWSTFPQLNRYRKYEKDNGMPFYIVIGLGGVSQNPERMFCIPLKEAKYPALYPSVFEKYERDPDKMFFWKDGLLK